MFRKLFFAFALIVLLYSCNIEVRDPLVGNWQVSDIEKIDTVKGSIKNIFGTKNLLKEGWKLQLLEDGTYQLAKDNGKIKEDGKWSVENNRKTLQLTSYEQKDTVEIADKNRSYEIITESSDLLKLRIANNKNVMILTK